MGRYYKLTKNKRCVCIDSNKSFANFDPGDRTVARVEIDGVTVSTVFLVLNHQWSPTGPPLLFETMIFGGRHDEYQDRCSTYEEALEMHKKAVTLVEGCRSYADYIPTWLNPMRLFSGKEVDPKKDEKDRWTGK